MTATAGMTGSTVDAAEVARFEALAREWWNPRGKMRPLHKFNPTRLSYIKETLCGHFGRNVKALDAFAGLRLLDVGCGGGLLCEPLAKLGASVTGIDPAPTNIEVAKLHAAQSGVTVDYRATTAEALADAGERFDVVLAMEVVEHVADVPLFVRRCAEMVKPGGLMLAATLNRTAKSFAMAIVGAEYVLRWLPVGTHSWDKFVTPDELESAMRGGGLTPVETLGVVYNPLTDVWSRGRDTGVNYMTLAQRPAG
jgi:2-polyprenyl-6-hydroxyphenyl methylase/3-demethylubiquinone-9 3-methyltransferase